MRLDNSNDRAFHVELMQEGASDAGGPYRELFDSVCMELMEGDLPILIQTSNEQSESSDSRNGRLLNFNC